MKNILFLIFLFLMSCGTSIKQIEVNEISDVQFMGIEDNQNNFKIRAKFIQSQQQKFKSKSGLF